jgi:DNA-binding Lrp family transcriptional regulator
MGEFFELDNSFYGQIQSVFIIDVLTFCMHSAFVLMNAELGKELQIVQEIKKIPHVKEVYPVYGVYDVLMVIESDSMESLRETITSQVRKLDGIKSTLTMIIVKD